VDLRALLHRNNNNKVCWLLIHALRLQGGKVKTRNFGKTDKVRELLADIFNPPRMCGW